MEILKTIYTTLHELNLISICVRILLTVVVGGCLGMQRARVGRAAGARTHILLCLGAAITTMLGLYIAADPRFNNDPLRMGAQVISGIGFLGVGTIMIRNHSQVRGLTTAAGLWTTACIGLCVGAGFYSASLLAFGTAMVTLTVLSKLEKRAANNKEVGSYYLELTDVSYVQELYDHLTPTISDIEIVPAKSGLNRHVGIELILEGDNSDHKVIEMLENLEHVVIAVPHHS